MSVLARAELLMQTRNYDGEHWLDLPGSSGDNADTPDAAALDIVGDIWLAGRFALADWTPIGDTTLIGKWENTANQRSYRLMVDTTGVLRMEWSTAGTNGSKVSSDSTIAPTVTDGERLWVAGTLDVSTGDVKFFTGGTRPIPSWTQLGTTVAGAGVTSIHSGTALLEVGSDNTGTEQLLTGNAYNAQVEDGYDLGVGTLQFDADFTVVTIGAASFVENANAATVTINGLAEIAASDWLDESGNGHHGRFGTTAGEDTNDPLFLPFDGQYLYLPGLSGNYVSTPDAAALDIVGDIWLAGRFALTDWTPAADVTLIAKWEDTLDQRSYRLLVDTTGVLRIEWTTAGTAVSLVSSDSTVAPTVNDGAKLWVAGTLDVSTGDVKFFTGGIEAVPSWTQLGTTVTGAGVTSIHSGTALVEMGADNTGTAQLLTGRIYNGEIENGFDVDVGTLVFDADFTDSNNVVEPFATFTESSAQAATVTINRATTGVKATVVDRAIMLIGTDDEFEIPDDDNLDFGATNDFTIMLMGRVFFDPPNLATVFSKFAGGIGYQLIHNGADPPFLSATFDDGPNRPSGLHATAVTYGQRHVWTMLRDAGVTQETFQDGGTSTSRTDTTTGTLANTRELTMAGGGGVVFNDMEVHAFVVFREALSDADVAQAGEELGVQFPYRRKQLTTVRM